jgi:O-antigen/teichoic acid export membrane protein
MTRLWRRLPDHAGALWALADQAVVSGGNFVAGVVLARLLGVDGFGVFSLAWLLLLLSAGLQQALIVAPMMTLGPRVPAGEEPRFFGAALTQHLIFCGALAALTFAGAAGGVFALMVRDGREWAGVLAAAVAATLIQDFARRYFFARGEPRAAFFSDAARLGMQCAIFGGLLQYDVAVSPEQALWVVGLTSLVASLLAAPSYLGLRHSLRLSAGVAARHLAIGKWLAIAFLVQWATDSAFLVVSGAVLGASAAGAFRAAQTIFNLTNVFVLALENTAPLAASRALHAGGTAAMLRYLKRIAAAGTAVVGGWAVLVMADLEYWLTLTYGSEFAAYAHALRWMGLGYVAGFVAFCFRIGLTALERTRLWLLAYLLAAALVLAFAHPVTSAFGLSGAALGYAATCAVLMLASLAGLHTAIRHGWPPVRPGR